MKSEVNPLTKGFKIVRGTVDPEPLTKDDIEKLRKVHDALSRLNNNKSQTFMGYLAELADKHDLTEAHKTLIDEMDVFGDINPVIYSIYNLETNFLNQAFQDLSKVKDPNVPRAHMNYMLQVLGQPILPNSKCGWGHLRPYGFSQKQERSGVAEAKPLVAAI